MANIFLLKSSILWSTFFKQGIEKSYDQLQAAF